MIEFTEHTVTVPHLPESLRGLRIVQLTDLHRSKLTPDTRLHHAIARANQACPDLILLTGDYVSKERADILPCAQILAPLRARLGVYAILGNHDYYVDGPAVACALERLGFTLLLNRSDRLDNGLRLVGIDDDRHKHTDVKRAFAGVAPTDPTLVLVHNPALVELFSDRTCVALAGHTHGGQIKLPLLTRREVRRIGAKHYRAGWYTVGNARLYVNRGLGQVGVPFRFLCRPEIALFTLIPADDNP